jgi:hypothetical protein
MLRALFGSSTAISFPVRLIEVLKVSGKQSRESRAEDHYKRFAR